MARRVLVAWSSGKDSAWTLQTLRRDPAHEIAGLFTTVSEERVAVHAVRSALLEAQARSIGLPLHKIEIPYPCANAVYEAAIATFVERAKREGVTHIAFGDLFLEDIRRYREKQFSGSGVELLFPLWQRPTCALAEEMTESGLRAWIVAVDLKQAPREWAGRLFDREFVKHMPQGVDPCGERGEFHTFAFSGPMFNAPIDVRVGQIAQRGDFVYADLVPLGDVE